MGPVKNEELIKYFKDRHAWIVEADDHPPKLLPYTEAAEYRLVESSFEGKVKK